MNRWVLSLIVSALFTFLIVVFFVLIGFFVFQNPLSFFAVTVFNPFGVMVVLFIVIFFLSVVVSYEIQRRID